MLLKYLSVALQVSFPMCVYWVKTKSLYDTAAALSLLYD